MSALVPEAAIDAACDAMNDPHRIEEALEAAAPHIAAEATRLERERILAILSDWSGPETPGRQTLLTIHADLEMELCILEREIAALEAGDTRTREGEPTGQHAIVRDECGHLYDRVDGYWISRATGRGYTWDRFMYSSEGIFPGNEDSQ